MAELELELEQERSLEQVLAGQQVLVAAQLELGRLELELELGRPAHLRKRYAFGLKNPDVTVSGMRPGDHTYDTSVADVSRIDKPLVPPKVSETTAG
ncbi:unnamed protein product [Nippostrongylus brasiliensis]|uniref:CYTH domain-containing protein n=1 Tax=Nippostrongylus brasiliensis TaxID=27835 RepID=A0A0N4XVM3_NIPBR|nr:unnamed protein product [Nippostrongylus brasiliensis]